MRRTAAFLTAGTLLALGGTAHAADGNRNFTTEYQGCLSEPSGSDFSLELSTKPGRDRPFSATLADSLVFTPGASHPAWHSSRFHGTAEGTLLMEVEATPSELLKKMGIEGDHPEAWSEDPLGPIEVGAEADYQLDPETMRATITRVDTHAFRQSGQDLPYGDYTVTSIRLELDIPHTGPCVVDGNPAGRPKIGQFSVNPSEEELRSLRESAGLTAEAQAVDNAVIVLTVFGVLGAVVAVVLVVRRFLDS